MFGVGPSEIILILVIALLVLGPERMPQIARDLGKIVADLRRTSDQLRDEFLNADKYAAATPPALPAATVTSETPAASAAAGGPSAGPPDEHAFDREMREARERLRNL